MSLVQGYCLPLLSSHIYSESHCVNNSVLLKDSTEPQLDNKVVSVHKSPGQMLQTWVLFGSSYVTKRRYQLLLLKRGINWAQNLHVLISTTHLFHKLYELFFSLAILHQFTDLFKHIPRQILCPNP